MKIDIEDINYIDSQEVLNKVPRKDTDPPTGKKALSILKKTVTPSSKSSDHSSAKRCTYLFIAATNNNIRALIPIQQLTENSRLLYRNELHSQRVYFYAMAFAPKVLYQLLTSNGFIRKAYKKRFIRFCLTYGYVYEAKRILKKITPDILILSNDHAPLPRAYMRVAQHLGIKTAYIQHASVTEYFPPLEFDYAFLDGRESFEKYTRRNAAKSMIFLSGASRFDTLSGQEQVYSPAGYKIGIAVNPVDNPDKVFQLVQQLLYSSPEVEITVRPHPAMPLLEWENNASKLNYKISDGKEENPLHFISVHDVFISGASSFHLDVAACSKRSYYFNFTNDLSIDYYGYIESGLITDVSLFTAHQIIHLLKSRPKEPYENPMTSYYLANYHTPYWGRASELISNTLKALIEENKVAEPWEKEENVDSQVYHIHKTNFEK
ncbi:MAG: hypothetical protein LBQ60_07180 [Bacteroidales bacterium]|jgi:hypothetical protein|nr:hypothetical protein [Bacteroidales bacterium]